MRSAEKRFCPLLYYIIKRLLLAVFTLLTILLVSYCMLRLAPGDPTRSNTLGGEEQRMDSEKGDPTRGNKSMREKLALDKPWPVGFAQWLWNVVRHGDFGESAAVSPGVPVTTLIAERLPVTLGLNVCAVLLTYLLAIPIGVTSAVREGGWFDRVSNLVLFTLYSLPVIWVGLLLQAYLCKGGRGGWALFLPRAEVADDGSWSIFRYLYEVFRAYALPVVCLVYSGVASLSRYCRGSMLEVINSDFVRAARAKGLPERRVIWEHGFRNALVTLITLFGGLLPGLIAGSVLVEHIFGIPGMGTLSLASLTSRDYPLQMALFFFSGALTLAGILAADLLYAVADARIRINK